MSQSLKVPVALLIANAEATRSRIVEAHAKAKAEAGKLSLPAARKLLVAQLRTLARDIECGAVNPKPSPAYSDKRHAYLPMLTASTRVEMPEKVPTKADTSKVDRHLRLLRSTSQDAVSVRTDDDFAAYL